MKNIIKILLLALIFTSCEDSEQTIYNGEQGNETFISFSQSAYSLPVERGGTGSVQLVLNVSTLSSSDRTYNIQLIESTSQFAADPSTYTLPTSITVPAGSYQGFATIIGTDNQNVTEVSRRFSFEITNLTDENFDSNEVTVNIFEVCPIGAPFTGTYNVEQITPVFAPAGVTAIKEQPVVLTVGASDFDRTFVAIPYEDIGALPSFDFTITFLCDGTSFTSGTIDVGIGCPDEANILFTRGASLGSYDTNDDSQFEVILTENPGQTCGTGSIQTVLRFTKVN